MQNAKIWLMAIRPKTLLASIAPVLIGTAMAFGDGVEDWPSAFVCLLGAVLIQIGTNLVNDYYDFKKGVDTPNRLGPTRVTQAGLIQPQKMKLAIVLIFLLTVLVCFWLIKRAGWPLAVIGFFSILSGIFYTAGPKPLGYLGLGEVFVFIFFGPVAVAGTYYVQSLEINGAVVLAGIAPGFLSAAILVVNNLRDVETDKTSGKLTLAVRFGKAFAQIEYLSCMISASLMPLVLYGVMQDHGEILYASSIALLTIPCIHSLYTRSDGPSLNQTLVQTGKILLIYSLLFSLVWNL